MKIKTLSACLFQVKQGSFGIDPLSSYTIPPHTYSLPITVLLSAFKCKYRKTHLNKYAYYCCCLSKTTPCKYTDNGSSYTSINCWILVSFVIWFHHYGNIHLASDTVQLAVQCRLPYNGTPNLYFCCRQ